VARRTDLAHEDQIERGPKRLGDLIGDRHPAPRQGEDDRPAG
jgi:hypothetical protein